MWFLFLLYSWGSTWEEPFYPTALTPKSQTGLGISICKAGHTHTLWGLLGQYRHEHISLWVLLQPWDSRRRWKTQKAENNPTPINSSKNRGGRCHQGHWQGKQAWRQKNGATSPNKSAVPARRPATWERRECRGRKSFLWGQESGQKGSRPPVSLQLRGLGFREGVPLLAFLEYQGWDKAQGTIHKLEAKRKGKRGATGFLHARFCVHWFLLVHGL